MISLLSRYLSYMLSWFRALSASDEEKRANQILLEMQRTLHLALDNKGLLMAMVSLYNRSSYAQRIGETLRTISNVATRAQKRTPLDEVVMKEIGMTTPSLQFAYRDRKAAIEAAKDTSVGGMSPQQFYESKFRRAFPDAPIISGDMSRFNHRTRRVGDWFTLDTEDVIHLVEWMLDNGEDHLSQRLVTKLRQIKNR